MHLIDQLHSARKIENALIINLLRTAFLWLHAIRPMNGTAKDIAILINCANILCRSALANGH